MVGACRNEDYWNIIFEERGMEFVKSVQQNDLWNYWCFYD
jgi:hypothetical protein